MKISKQQAARNREQILTIASELFRERGIDNVSVAEVMEAAGFTHGGFYNHFTDKGALALEACVAAFARSVSAVQDLTAAGLNTYVKTYLSAAHRDGQGGCPIAALMTEAARHDELQPAFADGLVNTLELFTEALQGGGVADRAAARVRAMRLVSEMVGALTLARAVRRAAPRLSNELLRVSRSAAE
ncbi:MAG TPA: TetR/AcrR family transcriptional regulator [Polyangiaceae bacterium]|nr:TetR/AcrR family transcriptional regulator [Polyangiaceae bacterium]